MEPDDIAIAILKARGEGRCLPADEVSITEAQAYAVQQRMTQFRLDRGERIAGWKLGYTSDAMREQMGITSPNIGPLTDAMLVVDGTVLPPALQPKVEPEIALVIDSLIDTPLDAAECREAVHSAHVALEVVDSVWCDYRFTWAHNTADGSSAAYVVIGDEIDRDHLVDAHVDLDINGAVVGDGDGSAAMGDPYRALSWLTGQLADRGLCLHPGDVVITGGLCQAVSLAMGDQATARSGTASAGIVR